MQCLVQHDVLGQLCREQQPRYRSSGGLLTLSSCPQQHLDAAAYLRSDVLHLMAPHNLHTHRVLQHVPPECTSQVIKGAASINMVHSTDYCDSCAAVP